MEMAGESFYKYSAFEKAAASVENAPPLADLVAGGEHLKLRGVGKSIGPAIEQLVKTGRRDQLDELHAALSAVDSRGARRAAESARRPPRCFSPTTASRRSPISRGRSPSGTLGRRSAPGQQDDRELEARHPCLSRPAAPHAASASARRRTEAMDYLREGPPRRPSHARRQPAPQEVTVGDVDLVCTSPQAADVDRALHAAGSAPKRFSPKVPPRRASGCPADLQIDLRVLPDHLYGNLLQHFTGSREHNIKLREHAVRKSLRVSENGILDLETRRRDRRAPRKPASTQRWACSTFRPSCASVSTRSIWRWPARFPPLVEAGDLRGDFHMHTHLERRRRFARSDDRRGRRARLRVSRDQRSLARARTPLRARSRRRLREQRARSSALGEHYGIRRSVRARSTSFADGSLDFDDDVLAQLDFVIGSVHAAMNSRAKR